MLLYVKAAASSCSSSESGSDDDVAAGIGMMNLASSASGAASAVRKQTKPKKEAQAPKPKQPGDKGYVEGWPDSVKCTECNNRDTWTRLHAEKRYVATDSDETYIHRRCWICVSKSLQGASEAASRAWIVQNQPGAARREERNASFQHNQQNVMESFEMCSTKKKARVLTRKALNKVFAPVVHLIACKLRQLQDRGELLGERKALVERLRGTSDPQEMELVLTAIEDMEAKLAGTTEGLAFAHVQDEEEKARWRMAAMYSDS